MRIDPKAEQATRQMLGHAMRGELSEIPKIAQSAGDERVFRESISLCLLIAGYIAIDVCGSEWPTTTSLHKIAENVAQAENEFRLDANRVYDYLEKAALGFQPLDEVFPTAEEKALWPILITASMLLTYSAKDRDQWDYLDDIEEGLEASAAVKPSITPAMILRAHMPKDGGSR